MWSAGTAGSHVPQTHAHTHEGKHGALTHCNHSRALAAVPRGGVVVAEGRRGGGAASRRRSVEQQCLEQREPTAVSLTTTLAEGGHPDMCTAPR